MATSQAGSTDRPALRGSGGKDGTRNVETQRQSGPVRRGWLPANCGKERPLLIISNGVIDLAEWKGAPKEAISWLRLKDRTFSELTSEHPDWAEWVIKSLVSHPLRRAYIRTTAPNRKAYEAAEAQAWKACEEAVAPARDVLQAAFVRARRAYKRGDTPRYKACVLALVQYGRAYREAEIPALEAYMEAETSALKEYEEATREIAFNVLEKHFGRK